MKVIISESQLNLIAEHLNLNEQSSNDYFGVAERYQKARGEELKPDDNNDANARILNWADTGKMKIWNNGRVKLDIDGSSFMGTMKITGNDSFKIIYDDGEVYRSVTNDVVSIDEDNMYVNCADSLDEIKDGSLKILKFGCKTDAVIELQQKLGMEEKYQTGYFGKITRGKVREFQSDNNLKVDGIVGSKTYGALLEQPDDDNTSTTGTTSNSISTPASQNIFAQGTPVDKWIKDNGFKVTFSDEDESTFTFGNREMIHMEKDGTIQVWKMPVSDQTKYVDSGTWKLNGDVLTITLGDGFNYSSTSGKWTGSPKTAPAQTTQQTSTQTTEPDDNEPKFGDNGDGTLNEGQFIRIKHLMKIIN